jgi:hypothetical protein
MSFLSPFTTFVLSIFLLVFLCCSSFSSAEVRI